MEKKQRNTEDQNPEQEQGFSTGSGDCDGGPIEAPDELNAIEGEVMSDIVDDKESAAEKNTSSGCFLGPDACSGLCSMVFDVLASRRGDQWHLSQPESEQLGSALDAVLSKYLPDNMEKWGPEITLITVSAMIILPRMRAANCYVFHYSRGIVPRSARVIRIDHDHQIL